MLACRNQQTAKYVFDNIGRRISFDTEKAQRIIPFQYLGVVNDYDGVEIKQLTHYFEMCCENYIHHLLRSHKWEQFSSKFHDDDVKPTSLHLLLLLLHV